MRAMSIRGRAGAAFLRLPSSVQQATLHALGKRAPWEPGFNHHAPEVAGDFPVGPPDFVGLGVQKAGTTWWYSLLAEHPGVYHHPGFHKERHFFGRFCAAEFSQRDAQEYHRWFPRPTGLITGEWTPDYLHQQWVVPMLRVAAPNARLVILLRDPVERFRSGLDHYRERGQKLTPMAVTDAFHRGLYWTQLSRLERVYPSDQILVLQYEACVDDPARQLKETFRFLGLDDSFVSDPDRVHPGVSRTAHRVELSESTSRWLIDSYQYDLRQLAEHYPGLDLDRWPSFTDRPSVFAGLEHS